jgi:hypothetical protein
MKNRRANTSFQKIIMRFEEPEEEPSFCVVNSLTNKPRSAIAACLIRHELRFEAFLEKEHRDSKR